MPGRKERGEFLVYTFLGVLVLALSSAPARAQECGPGEVVNQQGECQPMLVIPELLPSTEAESEPLYAEAALFAPDGKIATLHYLQEVSVLEDVVPIAREEIQLPLGPVYLPRTQRGYFDGHRAWDVTFGIAPDGFEEVMVQVPHPEARLLAAFADVPLGEIAQRIQASGAIEIFYVVIDQDGTPRPFLITYAHLNPDSVSDALTEAETNSGRIASAGFMGDTGFTDGRHIHLQTLDLSVLYDLFQVQDPITAYGAFTDLTNEISEETLANLFVDPSTILPQLAEI